MGQNRAEISQKHLAKLNSNVEVIPHTTELMETFLATFKVRQFYVSHAMEKKIWEKKQFYQC